MQRTHFALCLFVDQRCWPESRPRTWQKYCSTVRSPLCSPYSRKDQNLFFTFSLFLIGRKCCFSQFWLFECVAFPSFQWWKVYSTSGYTWKKNAATSAVLFNLEQHLLVINTGKWTSSKPKKWIGKNLVWDAWEFQRLIREQKDDFTKY